MLCLLAYCGSGAEFRSLEGGSGSGWNLGWRAASDEDSVIGAVAGSSGSDDTWRIFDRVLVPEGMAKKVYILGFGESAKGRIGEPPAGLDFLTWAPDVISAEHFCRTIDTMIHKTGGSRESYSRVLIEAYAHGGFPDLRPAARPPSCGPLPALPDSGCPSVKFPITPFP